MAPEPGHRDAGPRGGVARALLLGGLHGPAELLPVSSSAHVVLLRRVCGWTGDDAEWLKAEEVALHLGTALALLQRPTPFALRAAVVPAVVGLSFERRIEGRLGSSAALSAGLSAGALALALADWRGSRTYFGIGDSECRFRATCSPRGDTHRRAPLDAGRRRLALAVGLGQAAALWPGVSRYGAALTAARALGLPRREADERAREAAGPVLLGASGLKALRLARRSDRPPLAPLALAAAASYVSTRLAARAGVRPRGPLWPYAAYRIALAAAVGSAR